MKNRTLVLLMISLCGGCGKSHTASTPDPDAATPGLPDIMVTVNDATLSRSALQRDVDIRLSAQVGKGLTEPALTDARRKATVEVVDQFVKRELLLAQAEAEGVQISPQDEAMAFDKIRAKVEQGGQTLEDVMEKSPLGAEHMREEVIVGLKISKYLSKAMTNDTTVSDDALNVFKEMHADQLKKPETVKANHILVSVSKEDTPETKAKKRTRIESLRQQLLEGTNFADLARSDSDCPSRQQGGFLGEFPRGQMVSTFEDAAFSQTPGEIGQIVETRFGFHLILVDSHDRSSMLSDDLIRQAYIKDMRQQELLNLLETLKSKAKLSYSDDVMAMMRP
ncbi:MAG: peptidylprolyl isomerase [Verrucomicrobia bacterium]|nr:peptidylprolyl isomerase [Verrucomicrobiota bacterium]